MITPKSLLRGGALCAAAFCLINSLLAFEGRIDMQMTTNGKDPMPLHFIVKGARFRMETQVEGKKAKKHKGSGESTSSSNDAANTMVAITNTDTMEMITLMPEQKMYMVMKINQKVAKEAAATKSDFKPTGRHETIAGFEAEEYAGPSNGKWTELWLTKELGNVMNYSGGQRGGNGNAWEAFLRSEHCFALRVITRARQNAPTEEFRMETLAVKKESEDDSLFAPPAGYQKMEMPDMGGLMQGIGR